MQQSSQSRSNSPRNSSSDRYDRGERNSSRGRGPSGGNGSGGNRPPHRRHGRPSSNIAAEIIHNGSRRIGTASRVGLFLLALLAGGLMTVAAVVAVQLGGAIENPVWQQVALSFGFTAGLFLVLASNSVLFTEVNILVPANLYGVKIGSGFIRLFLFWLIAWIGNYFGVCAAIGLLKLAGTQITAQAAFVKRLTDQKLLLMTSGVVPLFVSGLLANWVMGIATFFATYNRVAMGKILCLFLGVMLVSVANFQYFPINAALLSVASLNDSSLNMWPILVDFLVPVSLGNLVGGAFLVSVPLLLQVRRAR